MISKFSKPTLLIIEFVLEENNPTPANPGRFIYRFLITCPFPSKLHDEINIGINPLG
jgi:hypothetical protein